MLQGSCPMVPLPHGIRAEGTGAPSSLTVGISTGSGSTPSSHGHPCRVSRGGSGPRGYTVRCPPLQGGTSESHKTPGIREIGKVKTELYQQVTSTALWSLGILLGLFVWLVDLDSRYFVCWFSSRMATQGWTTGTEPRILLSPPGPARLDADSDPFLGSLPAAVWHR